MLWRYEMAECSRCGGPWSLAAQRFLHRGVCASEHQGVVASVRQEVAEVGFADPSVSERCSYCGGTGVRKTSAAAIRQRAYRERRKRG